MVRERLAKAGRVVALSRRPLPDHTSNDLRDREAIRALVDREQPDVVLHLAAYREPDVCEADPVEARRLNVDPVRAFAQTLPVTSRFIFVSTDYVFDGTRPPYAETDPRTPISVYGATKAEAEDVVLSRRKSTVLRVPLLVGSGPTVAESGFIGQTYAMLNAAKPVVLDDVLIRYPTWINDVAGALEFLAGRDLDGVYHYSSLRPGTRYTWTLEMAEVFGLPSGFVTASKEIVVRKAGRPLNSQLSPAKIQAAGYTTQTDFKDVVRAFCRQFRLS